MDITIRQACPADGPKLAEMEAECFSRPWSEKTILSEMESGSAVFFIAETEGRAAGYAGMQRAADEGSVFNIAVRKEYRRQGLGRALAERMIEHGRELGLASMYLEVRHRNIPAIELYESVGFTFCGLRRNYYSDPVENALLMRLSLTGEDGEP